MAEMVVTFYFSPADGWICRGMQGSSLGKSNTMREEIYFYEQQEGKPFPALKRCERWIKVGLPPRGTLQSSIDITEFEHHAPYPEAEFTLSAFGLPEPFGVAPKKGPAWYLWFIGIAVAFLALGWYLKRRVRRREAGPSATRGARGHP